MTRFKNKCVPVTGGSRIGRITGRTAPGRDRTPPGIPRGVHPRRFTQGAPPRTCSVPS